ncbi:MAG TPA: DUF1203 domain-containing protein [Candidatus Limnocylindrales bacterium]|nr:DUF1203 domain-containing protein [Candidatus Limnocylindrales bacterium]
MTGFRVFPIEQSLAAGVRDSLKSPQYGHPAHVEPASGYGPCRLCLRQFRLGEPRILFTYNPFDGLDKYPSPGPVFIHAEPCPAFSGISEWPQELRGLPLTLEAYGEDRWIIARERPEAHAIEHAIEKLMAAPGVRYIHVRNTEAGCFIARLERWEAGA